MIGLQPFFQVGFIPKITGADSCPGDFIGIGWTNPSSRGANFLESTSALPALITGTMIRHDDVGPVADNQPAFQVNSGFL